MRLLGSEIVIATRNEGKVKEFAPMFAQKGIEVKSLLDFEGMPDIVEDGATFADNARIKARTISLRLGLPVVADDSGLSVDRLNGDPGVYSARYAGEHATDGENNRRLLEQLRIANGSSVTSDSPEALSAARFVCAICLTDAQGMPVAEVEGYCEGVIIAEPRGEHGFGYDPLFYLPASGKTLAELSVKEKNNISHRGEAMRLLWQALTLEA